MIESFKKPTIEIEALKTIKINTWIFAAFTIIWFLNDFAQGAQNYILYGAELTLIILLRTYSRSIFSVLLGVIYLLPIFFTKNTILAFSNLPLIQIFLLFLCYRCVQASKVIHGKHHINPKYITSAWIVYLLIVSIIYVYFSLIAFLDNAPILLDFIDIPFSVLSLLGLYGYIFKFRLSNPIFWRIFLVALVSWHGYMYIEYPRPELAPDPNIYIALSSFIIGTILVLPTYLALYLYGFKSLTMWQKNT